MQTENTFGNTYFAQHQLCLNLHVIRRAKTGFVFFAHIVQKHVSDTALSAAMEMSAGS